MSRIGTVSDNREYSDMLKWLLEHHGHEVVALTAPVDFEHLFAFKPEVLIVSIARKASAWGRPMEDFSRDVVGAESLRLLETYPSVYYLSVVVVGIGLREDELKTRLRIRRFASFPEDLYDLITDPQGIERYVDEQRHRKVSPYACPNCTAPMLYVGRSQHDLICPRCLAVVAILEDADYVLYSTEPGAMLRHLPCSELRRLDERSQTLGFAPSAAKDAHTSPATDAKQGGGAE